MKTYSRHAGPGHLLVAWCPFRYFSPDGLVIRFNVLNTGSTIYFTICRFMCET
jgi:hypothetical protein